MPIGSCPFLRKRPTTPCVIFPALPFHRMLSDGRGADAVRHRQALSSPAGPVPSCSVPTGRSLSKAQKRTSPFRNLSGMGVRGEERSFWGETPPFPKGMERASPLTGRFRRKKARYGCFTSPPFSVAASAGSLRTAPTNSTRPKRARRPAQETRSCSSHDGRKARRRYCSGTLPRPEW